MTRPELVAQLAGWIGDITGDAPALADDTDLVADLGLDSLALAELASRLRRATGVRLKPGELRQDLRVGAIVDLVMARLP